MAMENIGASNQKDEFYRYKMPAMVTKTEGKGNGIKTNIVNNVDIAKALGRPASYTTKYFGYQLGAQSKFDEKTGTSLVNGSHSTASLSSLLEAFIKRYVQCYGCGNPETEIVITKSQMVNLKCAACGYISKCYMRDKLTTFILKNPPGAKDIYKKAMRRGEKERLEEGEAADEAQKELKKKAPPSKGKEVDDDDHDDDDHDDDDDDDGIQWQADTSREAAEKRMKEQLSDAAAEMVRLSVEKEEQKSRLVQEMKEFVRKDLPISQLKTSISSLSEPPQDVMDALFNALFDGVGKEFPKEVMKKKKYLVAATQEEGSQMHLLNSIGSFCGKSGNEERGGSDIVEEEFVLEWYQRGLTGDDKSSPVWKNVEPFVVWLQSAEFESEGED
ncbi:W2 domain-containing protein [Hirschfeldia incana]|nr:W2 domain-containing protein [Hirschfeldia incana]